MTQPVEILINKTARRLILRGPGGEHRYPVDLGRNWAADKQTEGDHATPVGEFYVCARNPRSRYFLSLCISYPNEEDAARGVAAGLISAAECTSIQDAIRARRMPPQKTRLGGEIYIHGRGAARRDRDWTRGCIALENEAMQQVYDAAALGTRVGIEL